MQAAAEFERDVLDVVKKAGFSPEVAWNGDGRRRPDIVATRGRETVLVEAKAYQVRLEAVLMAKKYANDLGASVVICVPDDVTPIATESAQGWAILNDITLSPIGELGATLAILLQSAAASPRPRPPQIFQARDVYAGLLAIGAFAALGSTIGIAVAMGGVLAATLLYLIAAASIIGFTLMVSYERPLGPLTLIGILLAVLVLVGGLLLTLSAT